jgi:broad specificity phosphatase PhoE
LTELGAKQADLAGAWLEDKGIKSIYCSPSMRTLQTATIVSKHIGAKPKAWADIVEWGYLFDSVGLTGKEMRATYPDIEIDESFIDDVCWIAHKTTETWSELLVRAKGCLNQLLMSHPPGSPPVLLVTHAHYARYLVSAALGIVEPEGLHGVVQHYNCGISMIEFLEDRRVLWFSNEHGHLGDQVTK